MWRKTETAADYYSQRDEARKRKNKKGCFHSPFFQVQSSTIS